MNSFMRKIIKLVMLIVVIILLIFLLLKERLMIVLIIKIVEYNKIIGLFVFLIIYIEEIRITNNKIGKKNSYIYIYILYIINFVIILYIYMLIYNSLFI